jgi:hypothetical protein
LEEDGDENDDFYELLTEKHCCEKVDTEDVYQCLQQDDEQDYRNEELINIVKLRSEKEFENHFEEELEPQKITHTDGMDAIEKTLL